MLLKGMRYGQRFCACVPLWPTCCGALKNLKNRSCRVENKTTNHQAATYLRQQIHQATAHQRKSVPVLQKMHGALLPAGMSIALMRVASTQPEACARSVVVELMRSRIDRMASAANLPSSRCRILAVRVASTCPWAARRRRVGAFVWRAGSRCSSCVSTREAWACAHLLPIC